MDKELLNVLKLVVCMSTRKTINDNRYFNIISVGGGGFLLNDMQIFA